MPDRIPKFEETQPLPEVPRFEDTQPVDIPRFEETEPVEALPAFDQTTEPTIRDEIRAAIPEIVQQIRQTLIQPPQLGEFTPQQLSQVQPMAMGDVRSMEPPPVQVDGTTLAGGLMPGSVETLQRMEEPEAAAALQRGQEAVKAVAGGAAKTATFAASVANAAALTAIPGQWDNAKAQWQRVSELGEQAPLQEVSDALATATIVYGGIEGLKAIPTLYNLAKNSNLVRRLRIPERGLAKIPDDQMYRIYQTAPDDIKKEMATYNPQVRDILLNPDKVARFSRQAPAQRPTPPVPGVPLPAAVETPISARPPTAPPALPAPAPAPVVEPLPAVMPAPGPQMPAEAAPAQPAAVPPVEAETPAQPRFEATQPVQEDLFAEAAAPVEAPSAPAEPTPPPPAEPAKELPKDADISEGPPIPPSAPPDKVEPPPEMDPAQKLRKALAEAKPIRAEQELMYSQERANRFAAASKAYAEAGGGVDGFHAALGQLKGPLEKKAFESLGRMITQEDSNELVDTIFKSPGLKTMGDRLSATKGLQVLLQGGLPQEGQIAKLEKVFGKELIDEIQRKKPALKQAYEMGLQIANIPRSLMASMDISAPFRQGLWTIGRKEFWGEAWPEMIKSLRSEKNFNELMTTIENDPDYPLLKDAGLDITGMASMSEREEKFMSPIIERAFRVAGIDINLPGRIVRASGRAYVGFLNKLRLDVAKSMLKDAESMGYKLTGDQVKRIVNYVNSATGRGPLGKLAGAADALNAVFFSPRLMASRVDLLTKAFRPSFYEKQNEFIRKQYWRDLMSVFGFGSTILALAAMAGADIGDDPRSSDFGKIVIDNTRLDVWGGFQQYARMVGQLVTGEYRSSVTGKILTLGEGYKPLSRWDILWRQIEAKESPVASFIVKMMKQQDWEGKPVSARKEILERVWPLALRDIVEVARDNPKILPISALGLVGFGSQTYESTRPIDHRRMAQTMSFKDLIKTLEVTTDKKEAKAYYRAARKKFPEAMKKADLEGKQKLRTELNKLKSDYARRFKAER